MGLRCKVGVLGIGMEEEEEYVQVTTLSSGHKKHNYASLYKTAIHQYLNVVLYDDYQGHIYHRSGHGQLL